MKPINLVFAAAVAALFLADAAAAIGYTELSTPVRNVMCGIFDGFKIIAGGLGTLVFVVAGVQWIYNADDPGKRKAAREIMVHVIIGLIIVGIADQFAEAVSSDFEKCG
jgi:hypothetical protein